MSSPLESFLIEEDILELYINCVLHERPDLGPAVDLELIWDQNTTSSIGNIFGWTLHQQRLGLESGFWGRVSRRFREYCSVDDPWDDEEDEDRDRDYNIKLEF